MPTNLPMNQSTLSVIKYGGHAMENTTLAQAFAQDVARLNREGFRCVIVHGGGPQISQLLTRLSIESHFINGLRVTDEETMKIVEMALTGLVNKEVVANLLREEVPAFGVSGRDAKLLMAKRKAPELGFVGEVTHVTPDPLLHLLKAHYVPVVAPVAQDASYHALNVNADTAAGAIAGAMTADAFVLLSDVPGVLDQKKKVIPELTESAIKSLIQDGTISGGMIPKVEACLHALSCGAKTALIVDGREQNSLYRSISRREALGTIIRP